MIISKELVCEVLDIDERLCRLDKLIDNTLFFYTLNNTGEYQHYINIYELAHKCKEWAFEKGYSLQSGKPIVQDDEGNQVFNYWYKCYFWELDRYSFDAPIQNTKIETNSATEPEAIFKACQWLFENKRVKL